MQGLKDLVSVKSTDRRLPPIRTNSAVTAGNAPVVPSISSTLQPEQLPAIPVSSNGVNSPKLKPKSSQSNSMQENSRNSIPMTEMGGRREPAMATVSVNSPTTALFQTSTVTAEAPSTTVSEAMESASRILEAREEVRKKLEQKGIRTWPILAVLSVFFCNPIIGFLAAILTLKAENSYYEGHMFEAQLESRVAKVLLIIALVAGLLTVIAIIIWVSIECQSLEGCPG